MALHGILRHSPVFVLDRVGRSVIREFNDVSFTDQPKSVAPKGQGALASHAGSRFKAGHINPSVDGLTTHGVDVFGKHLLLVDQRTLPWTVTPMLERGDGDCLKW
jgi:hypothetical protein